MSRRTFLMNVGIALNAVVALAIATPVVAYLLGPVLRRKDYLRMDCDRRCERFSGGRDEAGDVTAIRFRTRGMARRRMCRRMCAARLPEEFTVFAINCAHLGCPVRWFSESQLFMCPCHGGVYYADGSRASGPPERGLFTYEMKVEERQADDQRGTDADAAEQAREALPGVATVSRRWLHGSNQPSYNQQLSRSRGSDA